MRTILLATTAALLCMPAAAFAQSTPAQTTGLEEVVVTAQRKSETLQRAAVAVAVVQGSDLVKSGVTDPGRLGELTPAVTIQPTGTGNLIFLRGVGNFTLVPGSDPAVAFNYDGVYVGRPTSTNGLLFDLDRVEVLKGPQGTLYGRNATGGAINVLPTQPKLGEQSGYAAGSYGNYNALNLEGAVNVPLGEKAALRVSGSIVNHDGYLNDGAGDRKNRSLRVQLKAEPTPDLTVRLAGDYSHNGGAGDSVSYVGAYAYNPVAGRYVFTPSNLPDGEGVFTPAAQAFRQTATAGAAGRKIDALAPYPFQDNDFYGLNAQIDYKTPIGVVTITPAWRSAQLNYLSSAAAFPYRQHEKDRQVSVEARLAGNRIGIFDYTVGALYFDEDIQAITGISIGAVGTLTSPHYKTRSFAPFGRVTANLTDRLRLVGGARYTEDKKSFTATVITGAIVCTVRVAGVPTCPNVPLFPLAESTAQFPFSFPAPGGGPLPIIVGGVPTGAIVSRIDRADASSLTSSRATYRAAVEYDVAPQSLFYASVETGYRSGGFSSATGFETFNPEFVTAYTAGLKNRFLDNRLQLNIEVFYWKYRDQQINYVGLDLTGRTANITQNIGQSNIKGFEVEGRFLITPNTLVSADVQYLDAKNTAFGFQAGVAAAGAQPAPSGCPVTPTANPLLFNVNCAGFTAFNSPKWTVNLTAQQTVPMGAYNLVLEADTQYKTERNIGFAYLPQQVVGPTWQTNAQVSLAPDGEKWSIAAFVRNIENDRTRVFSSLHPTTNLLLAGRAAPRTFGVRASIKY